MQVKSCSSAPQDEPVDTHPLKFHQIMETEGVYEPRSYKGVVLDHLRLIVVHGTRGRALLWYNSDDQHLRAPGENHVWREYSFRATGERVCFELRAV